MQLQDPFAVITPTLDGKVLAVLALADTPFTNNQLNRMLSASNEGIRKVLRRLTAQGIVTAERFGPFWTYRLNRQHLAAEPIIAIARLRTTFLERLEGALQQWTIPPVYAAVFGSAGRGRMTISSDIDLLLIRSDDSDLDDWDAQVRDLSQDVTRWTGNGTRPLEYTVSELDAGPDPALRQVMAEGLTVHGHPSWLIQRAAGRKDQASGRP